MSSQVCSKPASTSSDDHNAKSIENRPLASFPPSIWGNLFHACPEMNKDATTEVLHEELKQEVQRMLTTPMDKPSQKLHLIDAVQRLGVAYHFEKEIEDALENIYGDCNGDGNDLYISSLRFRLLREHGFNMQCESFNKFKDEKGNFNTSLISDVRGLLEFYEAAHLRVHGENILEEALAFTTSHLRVVETVVEYPLSAEVASALKSPIRKNLPRLEARRYIPTYQACALHDETLLKFAKLDFNLLQHLHKKEISEIYRWWKDFEFSDKLPFIRDRVVEDYFWILGVYFEPQYSLARRMMTKVIAMTSIIDDIYDAYGTFEELELFASAIARWDISCIDQLPDYMKLCYRALLDVYEEMEEVMTKQGKLYRVQHSKEEMKRLVQAYFAEAKWLHENYTPTMEEYMSIALKSCGYDMLLMTSLIDMGDIIPREAFHWASNDPKIVRASTIICRLMADIAAHKFERERRHIPSTVECYMKQYGVLEEEAYDEFRKQVEDAWKDINEEFLKPTAVPEPVLIRVLNLSRVIQLLYGDGSDTYTHVGEELKSCITSLLIDPVPI